MADLGNKALDYLNIEQSYFDEGLTADNFHFFDSVKENESVQTLGTGHIITIILYSTVIFSALIATIYEIYQRSQKIARQKAGLPEVDAKPKNAIQKYLSSFYLIRNATQLLGTTSKSGDKNLEILNGIRVLCTFWVIL